jgi:hypothetical protein
LSQDQLNRKARIPLFKEIPWGENPTLAEVIQALAGYHLGFHIDLLKEIRPENAEP